jgi:hypothetical protein
MGKEPGTLLMYIGGRRSGSWVLDAINTGSDGHAPMHDEACPYVAWETWDIINVA